ncbi:MAG TPA: A/G-specific adenine glycosylase [Candidatus Latescibacteria bacterium]|nr:A/G-specific adenine glycosylase [Candidatus Latescibacterota bacterium]
MAAPDNSPSEIKSRLLTWFHQAARDLPWRRTTDPYKILLSEFMLQQTQVDTVIPYYHKFLEEFPTILDLAKATQSSVLRAWEGLGYYARARNLHRAAQEISERFQGMVPDRIEDMSSLPGFGPYTTAAVLSIAYNQNFAVLDGNVIRVLCRLFLIQDDVTQPRVRRRLQDLATELLQQGNAGDYNQAVMELGATVCRPKVQECQQCPLASCCLAYQSGDPASLPFKGPKKKRPHYPMAVGLVWHNSKILIARRPEDGLLGGLWEFPAGRQERGETLQNCCIRSVREETGVEVDLKSRFKTVKHAFTHFSVTMHAFSCEYLGGRARPILCTDARWVNLKELAEYPFSRANRRLVDALHPTSGTRPH